MSILIDNFGAEKTTILKLKAMKEIFNDEMLSGNQQIVTTTTGQNGYPRNLRQAVIGFKNREELEEFISKYGGHAYDLKKRYGADLWNIVEMSVFKEINPAEQFYDYYDRYYYGHFDRMSDFIEEVVAPFISDSRNFNEIREIADQYEQMWNIISELKEGEVAIANMNNSSIQCVVPEWCMMFDYDSTSYAIGVIKDEYYD